MGEKEQLSREGDIDREVEEERIKSWTGFHPEYEPRRDPDRVNFFNTRNTGALKAICVRKEP